MIAIASYYLVPQKLPSKVAIVTKTLQKESQMMDDENI
jgi:hypothetical protein